jgi:hypothetical protein
MNARQKVGRPAGHTGIVPRPRPPRLDWRPGPDLGLFLGCWKVNGGRGIWGIWGKRLDH